MGRGFFNIKFSSMGSGMLDVAINSGKQVAKELKIMAELAVQEHSNVIIDKNVDNLWEGKNSKGVSLASIGGDYSPKTVEYKKLKGDPYDRVTLHDTRDFVEDFFVKPVKSGWELNSKDSKRNQLVEDWGEDIFGNTEEDEKEVNQEYIIPELIEFTLDNLKM